MFEATLGNGEGSIQRHLTDMPQGGDRRSDSFNVENSTVSQTQAAQHMPKVSNQHVENSTSSQTQAAQQMPQGARTDITEFSVRLAQPDAAKHMPQAARTDLVENSTKSQTDEVAVQRGLMGHSWGTKGHITDS